MDQYDPVSSFSDARSARSHDHRGDETECVEFLLARAGVGPALELAIGTGRVALPLADRGIRVDGIDFAPAMIERLREKPGGDLLTVHLGDFADEDLPGPYSLIFIVWNSFYNLLDQRDQVRCFMNVANRLAPGGRFVIEGFTPGFLHRLPNHQEVATEWIESNAVGLSAVQHDPSRQLLTQNHISMGPEGTRFDPVMQRYCWPAELDLMARLAGLELEARFGGWKQEPFDADSAAHVSIWTRSAE